MTLHGSGIELDDGRLAILFQATLKESPLDPSMIRGTEALRHTSLMVSIIGQTGEALFHNPAALRAFGDAAHLSGWFEDSGQALLAALDAGESYQAELLIRTLSGARWHSLRGTPTLDPVTGVRAVLLQQLDIHKRRQAEDLAAARSKNVDELNQTLAVVENQRQQILMLSAPILEVGEQTLAVPLIGQLSQDRIHEIAQRLLPAAQSRRCRFVILDLTGCSELDSGGARSLRQLTLAVELLGSRCIVTGIHPSLARAILAAGLDVSRLQTLRTLRDGIDYCRSQGL
jgi:anti-anti-sigma factor